MTDRVRFYENEWYMFSNFSSFDVRLDNRKWNTVEHAYQSHKFLIPYISDLVGNAPSAHAAKQLARAHRINMRSDWDKIKIQVMETLLRAKLHQHQVVREKLLETGDREIVENSPTDSFWGTGPNGDGKNHLGKLWMRLRDELRDSL